MINKQMVYMAVNQYVMYELLDAVADCASDDLQDNDNAVHAWDEGVAFWVGSNQPDVSTGTTADPVGGDGYLGFAVTQKRAGNFATFHQGDELTAEANYKLEVMFKYVQLKLNDKKCKSPADKLALSRNIEEIYAQMTAFAVQGTLRYAYKCSAADGNDKTPKQTAERAAFMRAIVPLIGAFDATQATKLEEAMDFSDDAQTLDYAAVQDLLTGVLFGMGLKCSDIGALSEGGGQDACIDANSDDADLLVPVMAGYTPGSNVLDHARIDLDVAWMSTYLKAENFHDAENLYLNGRFSKRGGRTISGFSNGAVSKLLSVPLFTIYRDYWGSDTYADDFVMSAFEMTGEFAGADYVTRKEAITKGAVYQNVYMYVLREFYDAVEDCEAGTINDNDAGVHAWDEGVAFYIGQLAYADGDGPSNLGWKLGQKRCANFGTCNGDGLAANNVKLLQEFNAGKEYLQNGQCSNAKDLMPSIIKQMSIPLIQGALRYASKNEFDPTTKSRSEGWAFTAAILPSVDECDSDAAATIRSYMKVLDFTAIDRAAVVDAFRSVYSCMGLTCADIGELETGVGQEFSVCNDNVVNPPDSSASSIKTTFAASVLAIASSVALFAL